MKKGLTHNGYRPRPLPALTKEQQQAFWSNVPDHSDPNQCWLWSGAVSASKAKRAFRYGSFSVHGENYGAHRLSYFSSFGVDPKEHVVMHSCDQPLCVNPNHLHVGTQLANIKDRDAKRAA